RTRGSGHMAPTYFCRFPGSQSDGSCGSALSFSSWPALCRPSTSCLMRREDVDRGHKGPVFDGLMPGDDDRNDMSDSISDLKSVIAVGIAFACQEIETVPVTPRDARLDLVLTEREIIDLRGP